MDVSAASKSGKSCTVRASTILDGFGGKCFRRTLNFRVVDMHEGIFQHGYIGEKAGASKCLREFGSKPL